MREFTALIFFIYGICIGSFLNVVIYRVPLEKSVAEGRSFCPNCKKKLTWIELIPLFSWIFQGGKCKGCKQPISIMYPLIEFTVGVLFVIAYLKFGVTAMTFIMIIFWSMLLVISVIDFQTKYIYNSTLIFTIVPIFALSFFTDMNVAKQVISAVICFVIYFLIYKIAYKVYGREGFGFGDVLLIGVVGYVVDIKLMFFTIFLPVYVAIIYYIIGVIYTKFIKKKDVKIDGKFEMPFGPSIATSAFLLTLFSEEAQNILTWLMNLAA